MIFLILFWIIKEIKSALFFLYLCQLKEYHWGRLLDYLKTKQGSSLFFNKVVIVKIIILFFLLIDFGRLIILSLLFILYFAEFLNVSIKFVEGTLKKPVFTKKTLPVAFFLFLIIFSYLSFSLFSEKIIIYLLVFDIFSCLIFPFLIFILQPITILERKRIIKKAKLKREKQKLIVIGITGSYGKTTTKEFLAAILSEKFNVLKTEDHKNSEMGISQTILKDLKEDHDIFVCEMAAYNKGGVKLLADIAKPKIGIVAGINEQHLALFGSMENLIEAEGGKELIEVANVVFFNGDDKLCLEIFQKTKKRKKLCAFKREADFWFSDYEMGLDFISGRVNDLIDIEVKTYGKHNINNLLLAIGAAKEVGMTWPEIKKGCLNITPEMTGIRVFRSKRGYIVIDSSYSANPTGVIADLNYLKRCKGKKVIIMPCLIELGSAASKVHKKIGGKIDEVCDLAIITTPDYFKEMESQRAVLIEDPQKAVQKIKSFCSKEDTILIEGRVKKEIIKKI